ncbi:MAG: hypothetical protein RLZZ555_1949 [Pseudomonadota bacterium]|jgi:hypothetical protein
MSKHPVAAGRRRRWTIGLMLAGAGLGLQSQAAELGSQSSIYTCTDATGRRITSDRPIPECMGTVQRELNPSGGLRRVMPPALTASERARETERQRLEAERKARLEEEKRRNHALVMRYPDQATHDRARQEALDQIDGVTASVRQRLDRLEQQHREIAAELEFYRRDPSRAPAWLDKLEQENTRQRKLQAAYLAEQQRERERMVKAYDDELARLRELWQRTER